VNFNSILFVIFVDEESSPQGMPAEARTTATLFPGSDDQRVQWEDPLAEFYASARAERDDAVNSFDLR
jgi:hypothetical protein